MPSNNPQSASSLYGRLVSNKPQGASKYRSMKSDLAMFGALDLYEYACPEGVSDPHEASGEALIARAEELIGNYQRNTSERSAAERLRSRAREVFDDEHARLKYDEYLQWCDLKAVFDDLALRLDPTTKSCTSDEVAQEIVQLSVLLGSRSQAEALMESFLADNGIEFVDARAAGGAHSSHYSDQDEIYTPQGRAQVRKQLSERNLLPDSALRPITKPTYPQASTPTQPASYGGVQASGYAPVSQPQPAEVGVVRRCVCGNINAPGQNYCQICGRPLAETGAISPVQPTYQTRVSAPEPEKKFPVATVAIIAVVAILIAGVATYFALNGLPNIGGGNSASSSAASEDRNTKRIPSGSVNEVQCAKGTLIIPTDNDEEPFSSYTVQLNRKDTGISIDTTLSIKGTGGFTIGDFNSPDDKTIEDVPDGTYEVVMTNTDDNSICKFTIKYAESNKSAAKTLKVVAN